MYSLQVRSLYDRFSYPSIASILPFPTIQQTRESLFVYMMTIVQQSSNNPYHRQPAATENVSQASGHEAAAPDDFTNADDIEKQRIEREIVPDKVSAFKGLGWLDRFLALWILLAMAIGILLGNFVPNTGPALQKGKFVGVSVPIGKWKAAFHIASNFVLSATAIGLLVMMYPILCKIKYESLHHVFRRREIWIQIAFSIVMNWLVAPFLMVCIHTTHCVRVANVH